jgi:hypothetical protein
MVAIDAQWGQGMRILLRCPTMRTAHQATHVVTAFGHRARRAMPLLLALIYATIILGWSAVLATLTVWRSGSP